MGFGSFPVYGVATLSLYRVLYTKRNPDVYFTDDMLISLYPFIVGAWVGSVKAHAEAFQYADNRHGIICLRALVSRCAALLVYVACWALAALQRNNSFQTNKSIFFLLIGALLYLTYTKFTCKLQQTLFVHTYVSAVMI